MLCCELRAASFEQAGWLAARSLLTRQHRLFHCIRRQNEKPFPEDFPVILGCPGAVPGAGDSGGDCPASGAAWDREPRSANLGGGGEILSTWWRALGP